MRVLAMLPESLTMVGDHRDDGRVETVGGRKRVQQRSKVRVHEADLRIVQLATPRQRIRIVDRPPRTA